MNIEDIAFLEAGPPFLSTTACGSRVTCDPPPNNSDHDFLVLVDDKEASVSEAVSILTEEGFDWEGSPEHYQSVMAEFMSWRKDDINLIVTSSKSFADDHKLATHVCKRLNLRDKEHRKCVFQAVLYKNFYEGAK